jgi:hypothetical protein
MASQQEVGVEDKGEMLFAARIEAIYHAFGHL